MEPQSVEKQTRRSTSGTAVNGTSPSHQTDSDKAGGDRLESWKEIAGFIGRDERTAMRWAKGLGMPVQRVPGSKRSRVFASRAEIIAWQTQPVPSTQSPTACLPEVPLEAQPLVAGRRSYLTALALSFAVVTSFAFVVWVKWLHPHSFIPSRVTFGESGFRVLDENGRALWRHEYGHRLDTSMLTEERRSLIDFVRIADLRGDGEREIVTVEVFRQGENPGDAPFIAVNCFSARGDLSWSYVPDERFRFGEHSLEGPWLPQSMLLTKSGGKSRIWVAFSHYEWGNTYVVELDAKTGYGTVRYVNTGTVFTLSELKTEEATYLIVGGFNNEHDGPNLALVNERKPFASSPQTDGS